MSLRLRPLSIRRLIAKAEKRRLNRAAQWLYENSDFNWNIFGEKSAWEKLPEGRRVKGVLSPSPNKLLYREKAQKLLRVIDVDG